MGFSAQVSSVKMKLRTSLNSSFPWQLSRSFSSMPRVHDNDRVVSVVAALLREGELPLAQQWTSGLDWGGKGQDPPCPGRAASMVKSTTSSSSSAILMGRWKTEERSAALSLCASLRVLRAPRDSE